MAGRPLRPATDRRLGGLLPRQPANRTQAAPKAPFGFGPQAPCGISPSFPGLSPTFGHIPTRCSPVRHSPCGACDLHVLSIPPAFALSQDQTLKFIRQDRAKTRSRRRLSTRLRSPLSMRSAHSGRHRINTAPVAGTAPAAAARKRSLASKRQMRLSKITTLGRHRTDEETTPRFRGAKSWCPKARRSGLQPHGPRPPDTAGRLARRRHRPTGSEGATAPLQQGARLGARRRQFQGPTGTSPEGTASRRMMKIGPPGPDFKTQ